MATPDGFEVIAEITLSQPTGAVVYEPGWQSWSPAGAYPADLAVSPRPRRKIWQAMAFRPERPAPLIGFQAEGLIAVSPDGALGPTRTWIALDPATPDNGCMRYIPGTHAAGSVHPHRDAMREVIATVADVRVADVSIKGKTNEGMGFVGRGEGIACIATATVVAR